MPVRVVNDLQYYAYTLNYMLQFCVKNMSLATEIPCLSIEIFSEYILKAKIPKEEIQPIALISCCIAAKIYGTVIDFSDVCTHMNQKINKHNINKLKITEISILKTLKWKPRNLSLQDHLYSKVNGTISEDLIFQLCFISMTLGHLYKYSRETISQAILHIILQKKESHQMKCKYYCKCYNDLCMKINEIKKLKSMKTFSKSDDKDDTNI